MEWTKDKVVKKMEELRDKGFISVPEGMFRATPHKTSRRRITKVI